MKKIGVLLLYIGILLVMPVVMAQTSGTAQVDFLTEGWYCNQTDTTAAWIEVTESGFNTEWTYGPVGEADIGCFEYSANYSNHSCCPTNVVCSDDDGAVPQGICAGFAAWCWQLTDFGEEACENADENTGENSVEDHEQDDSYCENVEGPYNNGSDICFDYTACYCAWINNECVPETHIQTTCETPGSNNEHSSSGESCWWIVTNISNKCDTPKNEIVVTTEARWDNYPNELERPIGCEDDIRQYSCPSGAALPFFTFLPFIISLMLIMVIYAYTASKKYL